MYDQTISALSGFVAYLDVVEERGDNTDERLALDVIDDILLAQLTDHETLSMIRVVMNVSRTWELDDDAIAERETTRQYLDDNAPDKGRHHK